jgi:hypothetical protein
MAIFDILQAENDEKWIVEVLTSLTQTESFDLTLMLLDEAAADKIRAVLSRLNDVSIKSKYSI